MYITRWTRWALVIVGVVVLVSCGGASTTSTVTPEQVHSQFLAALQANDRQAVLALVSDDLPNKTTQVDEWLRNMQTELNPPAMLGMDGTGGNLHDQVVLPIVIVGEGARGYSRWPYQNFTICHEVMLAQTDRGWQVTDWGSNPGACGPQT